MPCKVGGVCCLIGHCSGNDTGKNTLSVELEAHDDVRYTG